jgi:hypothetical protein
VTRPILVVIDGAKALRRAVLEVVDHPVIRRCQLHKLRNVTDRLPDVVASVVAKIASCSRQRHCQMSDLSVTCVLNITCRL